jgi:hypothetical protein
MATTTPNFGWPVPTSTDLVKDGATAIESLGDSIDASLLDLKGGTSGQVLAKNSNTDMDFVWVAQDDSNAIQNAIVDAKGDLIAATAADTPARLAVGTNGQVLTADSTASTGLAWATASSGSMTQLATGTLSGLTPSISSISGSYKHLELWVTDPYGTGANIVNIRFNSDSGANYARQLVNSANSPTVSGNSGVTSIATYNGIITSANQDGYFYLKLPFYSTTASAKFFEFNWVRTGGSSGNELLFGNYNSTSAISSIQFFLDGGTSFSGGTYTLYGVN